jgi:hypothetical protein
LTDFWECSGEDFHEVDLALQHLSVIFYRYLLPLGSEYNLIDEEEMKQSVMLSE